MILYRPVGLQELELIYDSGMKAFPARLPQQPIFYPVLQLEYARQVASDWNIKNGQLAGYVTQFKVEEEYIDQFEEHMIGGSQYQEFWIPAEEVEEFNRHIVGHIKVLEAHFGGAFKGFIPEKFGLKGKNAVDQFTQLANSYLYKRMEFYLEIKRNHKAVFLNYPFWQTHNFKNPGLKEKILQAIKEAWLTSFPKIPLPLPIQENTLPVKQTDARAYAQRLADPVDEDIVPEEDIDSYLVVNPVHEEPPRIKQTFPRLFIDPVDEDSTPVEQTDSNTSISSVHEEAASVEDTEPDPHAQQFVNPARQDGTLINQTSSRFSQGIQLGISGKYHEAIAELSKAVEQDPGHVVARTSLGVALRRLGEDDRALSCYEAALRIDPIYAEAHYFRANLLYSQGNVREAITGYTVAIGLQPELVVAHQEPAPQDRLTDYSPTPAEMYSIARPAHRILALNKALEGNPMQAELFKERAAAYERLRNYVQAIADYSSYLEIEPHDAHVFHLRGIAYEQIGQLTRAQEDYQRAIAISPQLANEYINRGVTFGQMGQFRQSIDSLTEAIRLAPRNPDAFFNRGTVYLQQGDFEKAIADFSNVIRLSPRDEAAYYWRGISNEETGRQEEAIADYRRFLAMSQDSKARKEIEKKLNQWEKAKQKVLSSRSAIPDDGQKTNQIDSGSLDQPPDLYDLLTVLGRRALHSTWLGSGVNCYGESAEELFSLTERSEPIEGPDLIRITAGIQHTVEGDFTGFDPGSTSHWVFIRAWNGSGFYIEINDLKIKERLKTQFPQMEEVEGASPPYESLFLPVESSN